jgi:hypothetical protein
MFFLSGVEGQVKISVSGPQGAGSTLMTMKIVDLCQMFQLSHHVEDSGEWKGMNVEAIPEEYKDEYETSKSQAKFFITTTQEKPAKAAKA